MSAAVVDRSLFLLIAKVASVLVRRLPPHVELDDLVGEGALAAVASARRYDPARGLSFEQFALRRAEGAMLDYLRRTDSVPRHVRQRIKVGTLAAEVAPRRVGLPAALTIAQDTSAFDEEHERVEREQVVQRALGQIRPSYARVVKLRLETGLTLKRIGRLLGVTEGRAGQLVAAGVDALREQMKEAA